MSKNLLTEILTIVCSKMEQIIGSALVEVILYGSFARGDYNDESDIDVAVIVNNDRTEIKKYHKAIVSVLSELNLHYEVLVSVNCIPLSDFEEYKDVLPYYRNIDIEGVRIVA